MKREVILDRIQGKVAERGTHRELISHDGPYRRLIEERDQQEADAADLD